jgi:hypothetical protein
LDGGVVVCNLNCVSSQKSINTCVNNSSNSGVNECDNEEHSHNDVESSVPNPNIDQVKSDICSSIKVLALNVCDITSKLKNPELEVLCSNYDILCFSESKLDQYDVIELKHFKSLPPLNRINVKRKSGGIVVFVRDNIYENVTV